MDLTKFRFITIILIASLLIISGCDEPIEPPKSSYTYVVPPETGDGWSTASISEVGLDQDILIDLAEDINNSLIDHVHSVIIIKDDRLVFEEYWAGHDFGYNNPDYLGTWVNFDRNTRHNTHSATKSFTSALIGIAINNGFIQNEDEIIFNYLPEDYNDLKSEGREDISIKYCLTMSSGLQWNEWDVSVSSGDHDIVKFNQSSDPIRYLLTKPLVTSPGTEFYYNGGTVDLLGVIVGNASSLSVKQFSKEYLFDKLGIINYNWQTLYPSGITCCHGDIYITPRDMAKIGYLFLNDGSWEGNQIISQEWVQKSTQSQISPEVTWTDAYCYLWWLKDYYVNGQPYSCFKAMGWGGQQINIFKSLNLVVVFTGSNYTTFEPCDMMIQDYILRAIQ